MTLTKSNILVNVCMMAVWIIVILVLHPKTETKEVVAVETAKNMV